MAQTPTTPSVLRYSNKQSTQTATYLLVEAHARSHGSHKEWTNDSNARYATHDTARCGRSGRSERFFCKLKST